MNNIEIIGIDHGWSQMKTSNTCFNELKWNEENKRFVRLYCIVLRDVLNNFTISTSVMPSK